MRSSTFKNRLFTAFAVITSTVVALFAALIILYTASHNRQAELARQREIFLKDVDQIESIMYSARLISMRAATNMNILNVFISLDGPGNAPGENYFDENLLDAIHLSSIIEDALPPVSAIERISLFNRYGDYLSTGKLYETKAAVRETLSDTARIDALTDKITRASKSAVTEGPYNDVWSDNPDASLLYINEAIAYTTESQPYGLVSVQMGINAISDMPFWSDSPDGSSLLLDIFDPGSPGLVYSTMPDAQIESVMASLPASLNNLSGGQAAAIQTTRRVDGRDVILMAFALEQCDWLFIRVLPASALAAPYLNTYWIMALGCLALLALLLIIVNVTASRISAPLARLSANISRIGLGNMTLPRQTQLHASKELIALDDAFRGMLTRLDRAVGVEMQAYLRALQAQVNPHFLYNMLSVIIASSESMGDERTVSMCVKLSEMLRYISDVGHETVPLADELNHARNYMDLMKQRYEDLFSYEIAVGEGVDGLRLPRLSVQPLAENCFVHGFTNEPPWFIRVCASADKGFWRIRVEDNGTGMSRAGITELEERVKRYSGDVAGNYHELQIGGMGLINTLLRLRLMHGGPVSHRVQNRAEGGLAIEIEGVIL
ncbi:MAG: histidine kinase [Oscillospiraceae bacterium]|jgi:sensor histidine kinase YesM|nr:histidine kinase [Oscillospiraceae bacterium]